MSQKITATEVNELRKQTGAGIMDCKKALIEANGKMDEAVDYLRKKGAKIAENRKDRESNEGVIVTVISPDHKTGYLIGISCETDFVAKNKDFQDFVKKIASKTVEVSPKSIEELLLESIDNITINDAILDMTGKIGEKITLSKYEKVTGTFVVPYTHSNNKLGVLIALSQAGKNLISAGKDIAMQIAAMSPIAVDKKDVDAKIVERELEIAKEQIKAEGKPDNLVEKIAQGKLNKFYKENTLMSQNFVKDNSITVSKFLTDTQAGLTVESFVRIQLGA